MKRIYGAGEPCDRCKTPTVQGKNGFYCKPCYIAWAESKKQGGTQTSFQPQNSSQAPIFDAGSLLKEIESLRAQIGDQNVIIQNMRGAFQNHEDRIKKLEPFSL